jgi:hypothetical protein
MNAQYGRIEGNRVVIPLTRVDHGGMEVVELGEITLRNSEIVVFLQQDQYPLPERKQVSTSKWTGTFRKIR